METIPIFNNISPLDFRYYSRDKDAVAAVQPYLSENAFIQYLAKVEAALVTVLARRNICDAAIAEEIKKACKQITAEEVYEREDKIKHNIRALANAIRAKVNDKAKPFVHFTATSHDIICTAEALRYKEFTQKVLIPFMKNFEQTLIELALREKATIQIGRTHGQHAEPITFGFTIAQYVSRFGKCIQEVERTAENLRGKMAGAVGAYNASHIFFADPESFEKEVLKELNLEPSPISTQIVEPEYMLDYQHALIKTFGVLANLSDDMRHLQRSEINEVGEVFEKHQVGSSTMPQKRNPINFENVKAMWKTFLPRIITGYMDQISEHQRDLTNSATARFIPEMVVALYLSLKRLNKVMGRLVVDKDAMKKNFDSNSSFIIAEPLYILLAAHNHPDAHEYVRTLTLESQNTSKSVFSLFMDDPAMDQYRSKFTAAQLDLLQHPEKYTGIAVTKTESICDNWKNNLQL